MSAVTVAIVSTVGGSIATALIFFVANMIRTASSLPRRVARLETAQPVILRSQLALLDGSIAIAEAVSGKKCNGNVDSALDAMRKRREDTDVYLTEPTGNMGGAK